MRKLILALVVGAIALGTSACFTDAAKAGGPGTTLICAPVVNGEIVFSQAFTTSKATALDNHFDTNPNIVCDVPVTTQ